MFRKRQILQRILVSAIDLRVSWQGAQFLHQGRVHLVSGSLEESSTTREEERVPGEDRLVPVIGSLDEVANMAGCVARREQTLYGQIANGETVAVSHFLCQRTDAVVPAIDGEGDGTLKRLHKLLVPPGMVPVVVGGQDLS